MMMRASKQGVTWCAVDLRQRWSERLLWSSMSCCARHLWPACCCGDWHLWPSVFCLDTRDVVSAKTRCVRVTSMTMVNRKDTTKSVQCRSAMMMVVLEVVLFGVRMWEGEADVQNSERRSEGGQQRSSNPLCDDANYFRTRRRRCSQDISMRTCLTDEGHVMEGSSNRIVRRVDLALCDRYNYINFSATVSTQLSIVQYRI